MRLAFLRALINTSKKTDNIHLITGDLGFQVFEEYIEKFPGRFTNAGVAEANLVGLAAGMAHSGFKVICYSITPFLTFRAFEQIRNDICYHNLDVKIVGVGGGLCYSLNGQSHTSIEDISVMRSLPNMTVVCPGDPLETYRATVGALNHKGPAYLRLGKRGEPILTYETIGDFVIGKIVEMKKGSGLAIFSTGNMLETTMEVVEKLEKEGIDATHIHVHTIKPLDKKGISQVIKSHSKIVTIEEHSVIGGLGSAIASINATHPNCQKKQKILGIKDKFFNITGTQVYLRKLASLDPDSIVKRITKWL